MGWPTAEFFVDVIFSTTHALRAFRRGFPRALGGACTTSSVPSTCSHTALRGKVRVSLKKGDVNKKFRRGRGYLQIVQKRSGVAHSCLSTLGNIYSTIIGENTGKHTGTYIVHSVTCPCGNLRKNNMSKTCARNCGRKPQKNAAKTAERCGTCQELAELFAENCGFGPNHETCCIVRIVICAVYKI